MIAMAVLSVTMTSCSHTKFEKGKWIDRTDPAFPPYDRRNMVEDLLKNHKLVGLTYRQLIDNLGKPDVDEEGLLIYHIIIDFKDDIDPIFTRDLDISYSKDSLIAFVKVVDWKQTN